MTDYPTKKRVSKDRATERLLKKRRKQQAMLSALGLLSVAVLSIIILIVISVRSCSLDFSFRRPVKRADNDPRWAQEVRAHDFDLAPWFAQVGPENIYIAQDTDLAEPGLDCLHINRLAAYPLTGSDPVWETEVDEDLEEFHLCAGKLVGYRLHRADPARICLTVYDAATGTHDWDLEIPGAEDGGVVMDGQAAILGYSLPDGYRLAAYNLETQAKAWGMRLPFDGMLSVDTSDGAVCDLGIYPYMGMVAYKRMNVAGFVATGTGHRVREFASTGYIHDVVLDMDDQLCYLLVTGNQYETYVVQVLPISGGNSRDVYRFETDCPPSQIIMHAQAGKLVLAYSASVPEGSGPVTQLVCFDRYSADPEITHELEGVAGDLVSLPGLNGEFLLAVNADLVPDDAGLPRGWGELWRVRLSDRTAWEAHHFRRPILSVAPFKEDCLVLLRGGEIYSYLALPDGVKRLRKARYPVLAMDIGDDGRHIAVFSWTERFYNYQPGQSAQVIVYE